jgi:hypothetical protein
MSRKLWMMFVIVQGVGVALAFYSSRFQVGVGGVRDLLWIPAMLVLLPGVVIGHVADALDFGGRLTLWYGLPFFAVVILINAACWNAIALLVQRRQHREHRNRVIG